MASLFKKFSKIDKRTKYGVYGWIRKAENELKLSNVPLMIQSICILYFYEDEIFNVFGTGIDVSKDKKSITKSMCGWTNNSYGITKIQSNTNNVYEWEFIIKNRSDIERGIIIGISNAHKPNIMLMDHMAENEYSYAHCCDGDTFNRYGNQWDWKKTHPQHVLWWTDDKITMTLNLATAQLIFFVNDEQKIRIENIVKGNDITYRMFVSMYFVNECVQLLKFTKK